MSRARIVFALVGVIVALGLAELLARVQGDRVCVDRPGAFYQSDPRFGWSHVPGIHGWAARCAGGGVPLAPIEVNSKGLLDLERPYEKPPDTARVVLLGGTGPEGLGIPPALRMARVIEQLADRRRGRPVEVINAAAGSFALDNALSWLRAEGYRYAPDVVVVVVDPLFDVTAISPSAVADMGRDSLRKPFFARTADGGLEPLAVPPPPVPDSQPEPLEGIAAVSQLYRVLTGRPSRVGVPLGSVTVPPSGDLNVARAKARELAESLLTALRDETAAAGGRFVLAMAPLAREAEAISAADRKAFAELGEKLGIPTVDLAPQFRRSRGTGRAGLFEQVDRWNARGHSLAAIDLWTHLAKNQLLPAGVVPVKVLTGGGVAPPLADLPAAIGRYLWESRYGAFALFAQAALLGSVVLWIGAVLPPVARDWFVVAIAVGVLALLAPFTAVVIALALAVFFYLAVAAMPRRLGRPIAWLLIAFVVVWPVWMHPGNFAMEAMESQLLLAMGTNVVVLRLLAFLVDARRGGDTVSLRGFLTSIAWFPAILTGPLETAAEFGDRRGIGGAVPETWSELGHRFGTIGIGLARLAWGVVKLALAALVFSALTVDAYNTGGAVVGTARLWLWIAELWLHAYALFSGLSDVGVGLAAIAGTPVGVDVRAPWLARDPADFWRRWLASFAHWNVAYLYRPLGGRERWRNVAVVFLLSALWFGWFMVKIVGLPNFPPAAARGYLGWAVAGALGVILAHELERRGWLSGVPGRVAGVLLVVVFGTLGWLSFFLPAFEPLGSILAVCRRLLGLG